MLLIFAHNILDNARSHKGHILVRKQSCVRCRSLLAMEITDKLGARGEYWVVKDAIVTPGAGIDLLYKQEVWFGNRVKCPNCKLEGKLPMDKPLNAESIAKPKEVFDAKRTPVLSR